MSSAVESFINYKAKTQMQCGSYSITLPKLKEGEQYRFVFDATKCIGCRCCEVACNEQHNNPAKIKWRRVGELEGGEYPNTRILFLSMGCNHCIDPECLKGCPTLAYEKKENGIVFHNDEVCIGCQYCTWNCPYDVPIFNPNRGVVSKCDMCYERIVENQTPACVQACPEGAIEIEVVNTKEWLEEKIDKEGNAPGLIDARVTNSTTRWILPENLPQLEPIDKELIKPAHKELPLVFMTVLTQIGLVGFFALFLGDLASKFTSLPQPSFLMSGILALLVVIGLALSALHLGRPIFAFRAIKNLKSSYLSKEALFLGLFGLGSVITAYLYAKGIDGVFRLVIEVITLIVGIYGIYAQSMIYRIPAKPTWNRPTTTYRFFATGYLGTTLLALIALFEQKIEVVNILLAFSILLGAIQIALFWESWRFYESVDKNHPFFYQISRSKKLLTERFKQIYDFRKVSLHLAAVVLPLFALVAVNAKSLGFGFLFILLSLLLGFSSEIVGRVLFFTTAVKTSMPGSFFLGSQRS